MAQKPRSNRWTGWLKRKPSILRPFPSLRMEELEARDVPASYSWTGLSTTSANWSDPGNWLAPPNPAPPAPTGQPNPMGGYDDLVFPQGPTVRTAVNDLNGGIFNSISFSTTTTGAGYTLTGNALTLGAAGFPGTGFINVNASSTGNDIQLNMSLGTATPMFPNFVQSFTVSGGLTISGQLSGGGSPTASRLIKAGTGTLTLTSDNSSFIGAVSVNADSGNLVITHPNALGDTIGGTTIGTNSSLRLQNVNGPINERVTLNGPGVGGQGTLINDVGDNTWNGSIELGTGADVVFASADKTVLTIGGVVSSTGTGNLRKEGRGEVQLIAANTYTGLTTINSGILTIGNATALGLQGTAARGTVVNSATAGQGQLRLASPSATGFTIFDEYLTLNGAGQSGLLNRGSLTNTNADNTWAGPVTLGSPTPNGVAVTIGTGGGTLTISGIISTPNGIGNDPGTNPPGSNGSSSLTKVDTGTLIFNNANTYACPTFIAEGVLIIRDSRSVGTNSAAVSNGATLRLEVEAGAGPGGTALPNFDAHGRNLSIDSVTGDEHRLRISNVLTLNGRGVLAADLTRVGALYSQSGINIWTSNIASNGSGIGVALDPRAGHPTPDSSYFTSDYSLTTTGTITGSTLAKLQPGHLILPVANTHNGRTFIESGWVTIQNNRSLGARIANLAQTRQPETFVFDGAAVHLRTLTPTTAPLFIDENLILTGVGPTLPYRFISQKGALMNIGGDNVVGVDSLLSPTWFTYVALNGSVGIGVEQIAPLTPGTGEDPSHLTVIGWVRDDQITNTATRVSGGIVKLGSKRLDLSGDGTYSLGNDIREGIIEARHNTALGQFASGTYSATSGSIPQTYTQTTTTVQSGANLLLDSSNVLTNGGISSGIQTAHEQLVLNSPGQQLAVAGALVPAPNAFNLTFTNHLIDTLDPATRTTPSFAAGVTAPVIEAELNKLPSVKGSEIQSVTTGATGTFTLTFNGQTTTLPVGGIPAGASALVVENALLGLSSIRRNEVQTVTVLGGTPLNSFTLTFNGQSTVSIPVNSTAAVVQAAISALSNVGAATVTSAVVPGGTRYTVTFSGPLVQFRDLPPMTSLGAGIANPIIATFQDGFGGTVTVTSAPGVPTGTVYTVNFGGDLAFTNLPQMTAAGSAVAVGAVQTVRDGVNGFVTVSESVIGSPLTFSSPPGSQGPGNLYTIEYFGDLANTDLPQIAVSMPSNATGTLPITGTAQNGGTGPNERQTVSVVSSSSILADGSITGSFTLTYKSQTTDLLPITAPAQLIETQLNALSLIVADVGSVTVSKAGNVFTIVFGTAHSIDTPLLIATPITSPLGTPETTISGGTDVDGYVSEASLVSVSEDNTWRGPVVFNSGGRIAMTDNTRINFLGTISDASNPFAAGSDLVKRGEGEVLLAGLNSYRGTTWIDEGISTVANSGALGGTASGTVVANNAQMQVQGSLTVAGESLTIQGTGVQDASTLKDKWFNVGPAPTNMVPTAGNQSTSARITSVTTDPTDANVIYVATAGGGAWKTKDRGISWNPLFDDTVDPAAVMYGGQVVVAPSNPNIVYFATGEANGGPNGSPIGGQQDNFAGTGVYLSENAGITWRLVTGPNSFNPIYGLAVTKLIVDPLEARRIYIAAGNSSVINGGVNQVANNVFASAVAGVYRFDGSGVAGTPTWVNLTGLASPNRATVVGGAPFDTAPPANAGPDDDYRIVFPQTNATWSDIALVKAGNAGNGNNPGNTVTGNVWVLYAALGESQQRYFTGAASQGIFNAVYRTEDPANTFAAGQGPTWWIGNGTIYPVSDPTGSETTLADNSPPAPTNPDQRPTTTYYVIGPESDPVPVPTAFHQPGRNEWIKLSVVVTKYFNDQPANVSTLPSGQRVNPTIQVYASNLGNSLDFFPYANNNAPFGRTGEFLDIQRSGWDGGIGTNWTSAINANAAGFTSSPFGLNPTNPASNPPPSLALGRYAHVLTNPSRTFGLLDTTASINTRLYLGGKTEVWSVDGIRATTTPTWVPITAAANTPADYFHALHIDNNTGNLLIGSDGGLWYDTTNFTTHSFQNMNGNIVAGQFNNIDPHPTDINQALAAAYNSGLSRFNGNLAWNTFNVPSPGVDDRVRDAGDVRYDPKNPLNAFASVGGGLYRTQDGGASWQRILTGSASNSFPVYVDPINPKRVLIGGSGIQESTNGDAALSDISFTNLNGGVALAAAPALYQGEFVADPGFPLITDKLSNTHDTDTIYITDGTTVRVTKNHGTTWISRSPFANYFPYRIEFAGSFANIDQSTIKTNTGGLNPGGQANVVTLLDGGVAGNELQSLVVTASSGTYTLRVRINGVPSTTAPIPFNATTAQVENAINALPGMVNGSPAGGGRVIVTPGTSNNIITDIAVDPSNRDTVYATVRHRNGELGLPTVFRTTDAGLNWQDISGNSASAVPVSYTKNEVTVLQPTGLQVPDADPLGITSDITVAAAPGEIVTNVTVTLNIDMTSDGDLRIFLRGPNGARVPLVLNQGSNGDDFTGTIFTDAAATPISAGLPPFTGLFQPESPLAAFNGIDPIGLTNGVWTLELFDDAAIDDAFLLDWTLDLTTAPQEAGSLPYTQAWTVAVDPRTDTIYIGNDQGVWKLPNASSTTSYNWGRFGDSLPDVQVHDLVLNETLNTLTASTYGRGMYQLFLTDYQPAVGGIRVISGNSTWAGPLTLTGNLTITADGTQEVQNGIAAASLDFLGVISDSTVGNNSTITKSGLGTIAFSGTNTYGGQTLVQQGVLRVKNPNALGAATASGNTIVAAGAALELNSDLKAEPILLNSNGFKFNGHFSGGLRNIANNNVYTGTLTLGTNATIGVDPGNDQDTLINPGVRTDSSLRIGTDPRGIIAGIGRIDDLGGNFTLDKELAGTLVLGSANALGGEVRVNQGALRVEDANALGSFGPFSGTKVRDGAALQISRNADTLLPTVITSEPLFLSGLGSAVTGSLRNVRGDAVITGSNDNTWAGPITFNFNPGFSPTTNPSSRIGIRVDDSLIPGVIDTLNIDTDIQQDGTQGSFGLVKVGPGRLNLMQASSFTGTTEVGVNVGGVNYQGGSLRIENPNSLGPNALSNSVQTLSVVGLSGTYRLNFNGLTTAALNATATAAQVEAALNALASVGQNEQQLVTVTGAGNYRLTFDGQTTAPITTASGAAGITAALQALSSVRRPEIQDLLVSNANGYFTLTFNGDRTAPLAQGSSNAAVQAALNVLPSIAPGTVAVTTSPTVVAGATVYRITFSGNADRTPIIANTYTTDTVVDGSVGFSEVQSFALFSTTGTFILSYKGLTTPPLPFNATAIQIQTALNALPSIGGVNGFVAVAESAFGAGRLFTLTFAGSLTDRDLPEIVASGVGGPVTSVVIVQDGLNGTVTTAAPNFTVTFSGDLASRDVPLMTVVNGTATATVSTTLPGSGVIVSETPGNGGKVLTVTFQRPLDLAVIPQIQSVNVSSGLAVNVATTQQGGAGAIVNNTGGPGSLEIDGDPTNTGTSINVVRNVVLNGTGVAGAVRVAETPVSGGTQFTLTFDGALGNSDVPMVLAAGLGGATTTTAAGQNGSRAQDEIQTVTVTGGAGTFTISLNGQTTAPLAFNATAAQVQAALNAISSIGGSAGALVNVSGNNTYGGTVTLATNSHIGANPNTSLNVPVLQDPTALTVPAPTLTKVGQGTLVFPNANAYGGITTVRDGVLSILNPQGIGTGRNEVQVVSTVGTTGGFTLSFNGQTTVPLLFNIPASGGTNTNDSVQNALNALSSVKRTEIQTVTLGASTLGSFILSFGGVPTSPLLFASSGAAVQAAFTGLSSVGAGNATVTRTGNVFTITFIGALANKDVATIVSVGQSGTLATTTVVQDGLNGSATVTSAPIPGGTQYTVTFGAELTNINLPEIITTSAMVFTNTTTGGGAGVSEVQTVEALVTGAQTYTLNFNGQTTGAIAANATALQVQNAIEALSSVRRDEVQNVTVSGTTGTFSLTVTTPGGTRTVTGLAFNIPATGPGSLQLALEGLTNVGTGNVTVSVAVVPGTRTYTVQFTAALGNQNIPQMTTVGTGATSTVTTVTEGLAGTVAVTLDPPAVPPTIRNIYRVTFGGDLANTNVPQMTGASGTAGSFASPRTVFDGNGSETQYVQVTASAGTFFLTFRSQTTSQLLFNATAADVERALNTLTTIGGVSGSVTVTKSGTHDGPGGAVYMVNFGGTLSGQNLPALTAQTAGATVVNITTGNDGPEGTVVKDGATLQLNGSMIMDREVVTINGQGFNNQGALNVFNGEVVWQALNPLVQIPLFIGTETPGASVGTTFPLDKITFLLPITDGTPTTGRNLDIYGPGTVIYAATGPAFLGGVNYNTYTGTTTVHEGTLLLSQPNGNAIVGPLVIGDGVGPADSARVRETINNQIADTVTIRVNSDGLFDLNTFTDTVSDVTVVGGHIDTGVGGLLTTGFIDMTGGRIDIRNSARVTAQEDLARVDATPEDITMRAGATIVGGTNSTLVGQQDLMMDASSIAFGANGTVTIGDDVTMTNASTIDFAANGDFNADNVTATGGHIAFQNGGAFDATNVTGTGTNFTFADSGNMNVTNLTTTGGTVSFANFGTLTATANISLNNTAMTLGDTGIVTAGGTLTAVSGSAVTFGPTGVLTAGDTTFTNSNLTMGNDAIATLANLTVTNGNFNFGTGVSGGSSSLTTANVNATAGNFNFGDNGTFNAANVSIADGSVDFKNSGTLSATGNVSLSNTKASFDNNGKIAAVDFTATLGSKVEFLTSGILTLDDVVLVASSLDMGDKAIVTANSIDLTDSSADFDNEASVTVGGPVNLSGSELTFGADLELTAGNLTMDLAADASHIVMGTGATATFATISATGGSITADDGSKFKAANVTSNDTDFLFGDAVEFEAVAVSVTDAKIVLATDGSFKTFGDLTLNNGEVTLGDRNLQDPIFDTQDIFMSNGSKIQLGANTQGNSFGISISGSTFIIGTDAVHTLGGDIQASSNAGVTSSILGPGTLSMGGDNRVVNVADGPLAVDLLVTAVIDSSPTEQLIKRGKGRLEFASVTGFNGPVAIQDGDVQVDTKIGAVYMQNIAGGTASLSGNGTVGQIDGGPSFRANGTVTPGVNADPNASLNAPGILRSGTALWGSNTTYFVNLTHTSVGAPVAGVDNDLLQVTGSVSINGAKLAGSFRTGIQLSDQFTIIQSTGAITGKFQELFGPNVAFIDGHKYTVQYNTNSVVLTKVLANIVSMTVTSSLNPATQRQPVVLTATMTPEAGAGFIPTFSTVTFTFVNQLAPFQTITATVNVGLNTNQATLNTNTLPGGFLPGGRYTVTAAFKESDTPVDFAPSNASLTGNPLEIEIPIFSIPTATEAIISPTNSPGLKDTTRLDYSVIMERGQLASYSIEIANALTPGTPVRTFAVTGPFGPTGTHTVVPFTATWNGRDDSNVLVPNGDYIVIANFTDEFGNTGTSTALLVVVDDTSPFANAFASSAPLISPSLTGLTTPQSVTFTSTVGDPAFPGHPAGTFESWTINIVPFGSTTPVRTYFGSNTNVSQAWDGRNTGGTLVPDGVYTISITTEDQADNTFTSSSQTVVVLNSPPTVNGSVVTPRVYGQSVTITAVVSVLANDANVPAGVRNLLDGDSVDFYVNPTTLLGTGTLSLVGSQYVSTITLPSVIPGVFTFNAGTYNSMFVRYRATPDFIQGNSNTFTLVVTPAPLTVTAANPVLKQYGAPVPALDFASGFLAVTGLVNSDLAANVITGSAATTATVSSPVNTPVGYPITQGTVSTNSNYFVQTFNNGKLFVTKAPLTVTIDDKTRPLHAANPPLTFTAATLLLGDPASVVNISLTTPATSNSPVGTYPITAVGTPSAQNYDITVVNGTLTVTPIPTPLVIGPGSGGSPIVKVYSTSGVLQTSFNAFGLGFTGGVRTATGDFNRDGVMDIAVATGPGAPALVRVLDGATGGQIFQVNPFDTFAGGVFVTAGDIDGDGADELVITPDEGGGPRVVAYKGLTFAPFISYFGINDPNFRGGARAAVGDLNGDGFADIAVSAGFNGGPRISVWDGQRLAALQFQNLTSDFFAFDPSLRNGAYVAIGDIDGDGKAELIAGAGPGGAPHVKIFDGADMLNPAIGPTNAQLLASFFAGDSANRGGIRVAVKNFDNDLKADLATGVGDNGGSTATTYLGVDLAAGVVDAYFDVDPFPGFLNGVFVG